MSHEVLGTELDDVQVNVSKVLAVSEEGGEHSVSVLSSEGEHEGPVK